MTVKLSFGTYKAESVNDQSPHKVSPIACVGIGDSEFFTGDEMGYVKRYNFDIT